MSIIIGNLQEKVQQLIDAGLVDEAEAVIAQIEKIERGAFLPVNE